MSARQFTSGAVSRSRNLTWLHLAGAVLLVSASAHAQGKPQSCATLRLAADGNLGCDVGAGDGLNLQAISETDQPIGFVSGPGLDIIGDPIVSYATRSRFSGQQNGPTGIPFVGNLGSPLSAFSVSSIFGERFHPILRTNRMHSGIDLAAPTGSRVYSAGGGVVTLANWDGGYGLSVRIRHSTGVETRYAHLSSLFVHQGQSVAAGEAIGAVGSTGLSTGPHLHYELRINGVPNNPRGLRSFKRF